MIDPGFGIYIHWPFCAAKCPYCDFNSHVRTKVDEDSWSDGIARELKYIADWQGADRPIVQTIFFGGGTPSLMSGKAVGGVIDKIARSGACPTMSRSRWNPIRPARRRSVSRIIATAASIAYHSGYRRSTIPI